MFATRQYFTQYLLKCGQLENLAQRIRQSIASNPYFQVLSVFERFDKFRKGYLEPADFSQFMLENKIYPTQSELYLIFRDFDQKRMGVITVDQFQEQILPRENRKLKKDALKRNPYPVELKLSIDLEFLIGKYFEDKIKAIHVLDEIVIKIRSTKQYAVDQCFLLLDQNRVGYLQGLQDIDGFLRKNGKALSHEDLTRIYRFLSQNNERQITIEMFRERLTPFDIGLYPGYESKVREKEALQHRFLEKKYQAESQRIQNIYKRQELENQITHLRSSNRRLQQIMDEQDLARLADYHAYYPYN